MHLHPHTDEGFYVADGELTFVFQDREVVGNPGTFVSCRAASSTPHMSPKRCVA